MNKTVAVIRGDGIGPEVIDEALEVLSLVGKKFGHRFAIEEAPMGGGAIDAYGVPMPPDSLQTCLAADAVLLGAVGGPKWDNNPPELRPEKALFAIRKGMNAYANIRPAKIFPALASACPLRPDIAAKGIDLVIVRELTGGIYFGEHASFEQDGERAARDVMTYSEHEIRRIAHVGFRMAQARRRRVTSVDKANVLATSRLWRDVVCDVAKEYPDVELDHMYVDNASMQLIRDPGHFDVIVTENTFGDILSDEASQITGSIGMIPSSSLGEGTDGRQTGLYEPIHGSAPDIAGQDKANPVATILAAAMMLRHSFGLTAEAEAVEDAVEDVLAEGWRTGDIMEPGKRLVGCREMGRRIREKI